ncbi:MAG: hypothetical protein K8W52_31095 [Deltaproteobacteria bacterium]|nr:hypothetical protein [Deltaproteobacteria bacterium]
MRTWTRLSAILATAGATLLATACGGGSSNPDSRVTDTNMNPDAGTPDGSPDAAVATRALTISIADVTVTTPGAAGLGLKGGVILLEPADVTQGGGELVFGTSPVGGCVVYKYSNATGSTSTPNPIVDEGAFTLTGAGLLKPTGTCSFVPGAGYVCIVDAGSATASATHQLGPLGGAGGPHVYSLKFTGKDFSGTDLVGTYVKVTGLATAQLSGSFAVIAQPAADTLNVLVPSDINNSETDVAGVTYTFVAGAGPIPTALGANADFLSDDGGRSGAANDPPAEPVIIHKAAGTQYGEVMDTIEPAGEGFILDPAGDKPQAFPSTARDVTFSCTTCGTKTGEPLYGMLISGRTTDAPVPASPDFYMPPASAGTTYHTFTCGFPFGMSATIPSAAVAEILKDTPTRIETRVFRAALHQPADTLNPLNAANIVVGHGFVGHTTINPAAK